VANDGIGSKGLEVAGSTRSANSTTSCSSSYLFTLRLDGIFFRQQKLMGKGMKKSYLFVLSSSKFKGGGGEEMK
jgi:hypothetical protein